MAKDIFGAPRRRNVSPKSSTLHVQTRDVDCSALAQGPEDGEFILLSGARPSDVTFHGAAADVDAAELEGSMLRMVWGSARRSDRAALKGRRTTVIAHGAGLDLDTALYQVANEDELAQSDNFPAGTLLSVGKQTTALDAVAGDAQGRFVLEAMLADSSGWCVGYVREAVSGDCGNGKAIKIHLYSTPRYIGATNAGAGA